MVGLYFSTSRSRHKELIDQLIADNIFSLDLKYSEYDHVDFSLCRCSNRIFNDYTYAQDSRYIIWMDGVSFKKEKLWKSLNLLDRRRTNNDCELILELLHNKIPIDKLASKLEGQFFITILDKQKDDIYFINDRFGLRPHYYSAKGIFFVIAPSIKYCLSMPWISSEIDKQSLTEWFCFQCVMEERTLFKNINLFPAGSVATYNLKDKTLNIKKYAKWKDLITTSFNGTFDEAVEKTALLFRTACNDKAHTEKRKGVYLSGGLDSRTILAAIGGGKDIHTFCFGPKSSPDITYAKKCARTMKTSHHEFIMDDGNWIKEIAGKHTKLTEGWHCLIHSHNLWKAEEAQKYIDINFNGHFGDLLMGGSYLFYGKKENLLDSLWGVFLSKWGSRFSNVDEFNQLSGLCLENLNCNLKNSFQRSMSEFEDIPVAMAHDLFSLQFHGRKQIQYYMVHNWPYFESTVPFLDIDLLKFIFSLPLEYRENRRLQIAVLNRLEPGLTKIPWTGTTLPPINKGYPKLKNRLKCEINRCTKHFFDYKMFSPKSPLFNTCYYDWLKVDLETWVDSIFVDNNAKLTSLFAGKFIQQVISDVISESKSLQAIHTRIGLLVTLELLLKEFNY